MTTPAPATGPGAPAGWASSAPRVLAALALVAVAAGYVALWRGGTSGAALLLVAGYCVLAPLALAAALRRATRRSAPETAASVRRTPSRLPNGRAVVRQPAEPATDDAPPYRTAALVAAGVLALYAATLAPSTAMWDTSEYIAVAKVLGLPHPPGNPLFVLLAHVAGLVPLPIGYAARINLLAALTSALSAGLWCLVTDRVTRTIVPSARPRRAVAVAGALIGATAFTVWNQSVVNEKVYTVSLLGLALTSWLTLRWLDADRAGATARADRLLVAIAYLAGLAYAVHPAGFLVLPAVALAVVVRRPRTLLRARLLATLALALGIGLTPFAFEPIRAAHAPPINEGVPTACVGGPTLGCTFSAETARRLKANIDREQYGGHPVLERQAPFGAQLSMFWLYFRWQWLRDADGRTPVVQLALALGVVALGLYGGWTQARRDPATFAYLAPLVATLGPVLVFYLNFKYGSSQDPALGDAVDREVRDRDYFFVWTYAVWAVWTAAGLGALWTRLAAAVTASRAPNDSTAATPRPNGRGGRPLPVSARGWLVTAPLLLLALVPLAGNARDASRAGQHFTAAWARDLLQSVEPYAVLVTNGDNDSFPLWYAQQVEGVRRDVTVALVPYLRMNEYVRQLNHEPPAAYDAARGPAVYRGRAWTRPTAPLLRLTDAEIAALPPYAELSAPERFVHGAIDATVPAGLLIQDQLVVLRVIRDSFPARAVYFSTGNYAQQLGLGPYLRAQGLAQRLDSTAGVASPDLLPARGGGFLDVPRTQALWDSVYQAPAALRREGRWVDRASVNIPVAYIVTGDALARALAAKGDSARAVRVANQVDALVRAARLDTGA